MTQQPPSCQHPSGASRPSQSRNPAPRGSAGRHDGPAGNGGVGQRTLGRVEALCSALVSTAWAVTRTAEAAGAARRLPTTAAPRKAEEAS